MDLTPIGFDGSGAPLYARRMEDFEVPGTALASGSDPGRFVIPDELVLSHTLYEAYGDVPYAWHVFVLKDLDALNAVRDAGELGEANAFAWTSMYDEPDGDNSVGVMYFAAGWVYVGMVAHEALHLASWMCRFPKGKWPIRGRFQTRPQRMTLGREPERLAEIVGQLTSVVWYNLEKDGLVDVDKDGD